MLSNDDINVSFLTEIEFLGVCLDVGWGIEAKLGRTGHLSPLFQNPPFDLFDLGHKLEFYFGDMPLFFAILVLTKSGLDPYRWRVRLVEVQIDLFIAVVRLGASFKYSVFVWHDKIE